MTPPERGHWRAGVDSGLGLLGPEVSLRHPRGDARWTLGRVPVFRGEV